MTSHTPRQNPSVRLRFLTALMVLTLFSSAGCSQGSSAPTQPGQPGKTPAPSEAFETEAMELLPEAETPLAAPNATVPPQELFTLPPTFRFPDLGCSVQWPVRVETRPSNLNEIQYLDEIQVCETTSRDETVITNNSPVVWNIDSQYARSVGSLTSAPKTVAFHEMVVSRSFYTHAFMAPGETAVLAGSSEGLMWFIHNELTVAWLGYSPLHDEITAYGTKAVRGLVTGKSTSKKALFDCALAYYSVLDKGGSLTSQDTDALLGGFAIAASVGSCATSWKAAEKELGRKNFPSLVDDVANVGKVATNVTKLRNGWRWLRAACSVLPRC